MTYVSSVYFAAHLWRPALRHHVPVVLGHLDERVSLTLARAFSTGPETEAPRFRDTLPVFSPYGVSVDYTNVKPLAFRYARALALWTDCVVIDHYSGSEIAEDPRSLCLREPHFMDALARPAPPYATVWQIARSPATLLYILRCTGRTEAFETAAGVCTRYLLRAPAAAPIDVVNEIRSMISMPSGQYTWAPPPPLWTPGVPVRWFTRFEAFIHPTHPSPVDRRDPFDVAQVDELLEHFADDPRAPAITIEGMPVQKKARRIAFDLAQHGGHNPTALRFLLALAYRTGCVVLTRNSIRSVVSVLEMAVSGSARQDETAVSSLTDWHELATPEERQQRLRSRWAACESAWEMLLYLRGCGIDEAHENAVRACVDLLRHPFPRGESFPATSAALLRSIVPEPPPHTAYDPARLRSS